MSRVQLVDINVRVSIGELVEQTSISVYRPLAVALPFKLTEPKVARV
jgi:hypothetical protein